MNSVITAGAKIVVVDALPASPNIPARVANLDKSNIVNKLAGPKWANGHAKCTSTFACERERANMAVLETQSQNQQLNWLHVEVKNYA